MTDYNNDVKAIREAFEEGKGRKLLLSDAILDLVVDNCKTWDEMDENETYSFLEKAEQEASKVSIADPQISVLAAKFDEDDAAQAELTDCIEAVIKSKTTAVDMYAVFHRIYSREELDGMPRAGWEEAHCVGTNFKPDVVKKVAANGKPTTTVWTNDFVSATGRGKALETTIDEAAKALKSANSIPKYAGKSDKALEDIKQNATQARNAMRSMVKRALEVHHSLESIKMLPNVVIEWIEVGESEKHISIPRAYGSGKLGKDPIRVTRSAKPFWMYPKGQPSEGRAFSVTQINNMDVAAALAAGGTMKDLVESLTRDTNKSEGDGDGATWDESEAGEGMSKLANFFHKRDNVAMVAKIMADPKHPERNDWLENISTLYFAIKPLYLKNQSAIEEATGAKEEKAA